MPPSFKHKFVSLKGDGPDATLVKPGGWNDEHKVTVSTVSVLGAVVVGDVVELPLVVKDGADPGTIWTKAAVEKAIADAIAALGTGLGVGDLVASMAATKTGFLLLNGQTIGNIGSAATFAATAAQPLFNLFWGINTNTWPVLLPDGTPSRGGTALADWNAAKKIPLPDARGRGISMLDLGAGVTSLILRLGEKYGSSKVALQIANLPPHTHDVQVPSGAFVGYGTGGYVPGDGLGSFDPLVTSNPTGGDPTATPAYSVPAPVNITPSVIGANIFIKY